MSNYQPTEPYIYQPDPPFNKDGSVKHRIYAIAGPGASAYAGMRFNKVEAEERLKSLLNERKRK